MPFKFKLAARAVPLWNGKAGNSRASRRQQPSATVRRTGGICGPAFGDSREFCWAVPAAGYFLGSYRILKSRGNSETLKGSDHGRSSPGFQGQEPQAFIYHGILSTLLTLKKTHTKQTNKKQPSKLTLLSDHHPNSLYSASGHSSEKTEHWKLRKQIWNCSRITTVLAVDVFACCNN